MRDDVIESLSGTCSVLFTPNELVEELLDDLTAEQAQCILEHSWDDATEIVHDVCVTVGSAGLVCGET